MSGMTDKERDQIDTDAETYMRTCSFAINSLKGEGMVQLWYINNILFQWTLTFVQDYKELLVDTHSLLINVSIAFAFCEVHHPTDMIFSAENSDTTKWWWFWTQGIIPQISKISNLASEK